MNVRIGSLSDLTTEVSPYGFPMDVGFEWQEGESPIYYPTDMAHPGTPSNAVLTSCRVGGVDIMDMLSSSQIERIEDAIIEQMEES